VADASTGIILAEADIGAPPERVFKALTTREVERWWGHPDFYRSTGWKAELRARGPSSVAVNFKDGKKGGGYGESIEVDPPRKVVYTRRFLNNPFTCDRELTVTSVLAPVAAGTRLTVREEGYLGRNEAAYGDADH
jgi:uncharacterized protein YndB with AHSA1/START domain